MPTPLRWLLALTCAAHAAPGTSLLTLVPPNATTGINSITITVQPLDNPAFADTERTQLTGTVTADLEIDIANNFVIEMSLRNGRGNASNLTFSRLGIPSYTINFQNLSFAIDTPNPPGIVSNPSTGTFDASQHRFLLDQGTATGSYTVFITPTPINQTFTPANPLGGPGQGNGTITVVRTGTRPGFVDYSATLNFPVAINQLQGDPGQQVRVIANGTIRATGTLSVSSSGYLQWTLEEGIRGAPRDGDFNEDGISNILSWGLGLDAMQDARPHLPQVLGNRSYRLPLPIGGSGAPLRLMISNDLSQWTPVPTSRISTGQNPLPAGATGNITVIPAAATREYFRLEVIE